MNENNSFKEKTMKTIPKDYQHLLEAVACLYTVDNGCVKVFLLKQETEPYKGYWVLPRVKVSIQESCEEAIKKEIENHFQFQQVILEEVSSYSEPNRVLGEPIVSICYSGSVHLLDLQKDTGKGQWFPIQELPKIGYDHSKMIQDSKKKLQEKLTDLSSLKELFPSDFTLPEIQGVFESVLDKKIDRRNFRKRFLSFGYLEETGDYEKKGTGRPAKLYRFKEQEEKKLF